MVEMTQIKNDTGTHYRFSMLHALTDTDRARGYVEVQIDPFRIADVYQLDFIMGTVLKKALCAGNRGHNDLLEDIDDIICALERKKQMMQEDRATALASMRRKTDGPLRNNEKDRGEVRT